MLIELVLGAFQLLLGANPAIVVLTLATGLVTIAPCFAYGLNRTVGVLFVLIWYVYSGGELLTKSLLFQPIDSNLFAPLLSHQIQLAGGVAMTLGALAALWLVPFKANLIRPTLDVRLLRTLSWVFLAIFAASFVAQRGGANGQALAPILRNFIYAALVTEIMVTVVEKAGRVVSARSLALAAGVAFLSLSVNSKTGILVVGACFLLVPMAVGRMPSKKLLVFGVLGFAAMTMILAPAIHLTRAERDKAGPLALITATATVAAGIVTDDDRVLAQIEGAKRQEALRDPDTYRNRYLGDRSSWYERFVLIGLVDAIARRLSPDGPFMGASFILSQTREALPRQLGGEKSKYNSSSRINQALGLSPRDTNLFTTMPLPVELFAAAGFSAVFLVGIPVTALAFIALNLVAFDFRKNVWACYMLVTFGYFFTMQGYLGFVFFSIRQAPTSFLLIAGSMILAQVLHRRSRGPTAFPNH